MIATGVLANLSYWVAILGFFLLCAAAILSPWLASKRTENKLGKPNGNGDNIPKEYRDHNLYELVVESIVLSKDAVEKCDANAEDICKIKSHLGINE